MLARRRYFWIGEPSVAKYLRRASVVAVIGATTNCSTNRGSMVSVRLSSEFCYGNVEGHPAVLAYVEM